jgi:DNA repair exonuclease SbcCD nuclease subunit
MEVRAEAAPERHGEVDAYMSLPFRLAHISDTHLGYRAINKLDPESGRNQRTVDTDRAFTRLIDDLVARKVDGVIHSGDVFHHSRPTWQSLRHFIRQMRRLEDAGIPTLVIAGNHDTPRIRTGGSAYSVLELALPNIRFVTEFEDVTMVDTFAAFDVMIHAIPHGALTNPDPVLPDHVPGMRNILTVHGLVPGILPVGIVTEPGEQLIDHRLLDARFDYIALGHIHQAQQVAPNAWYAGSTERFGWNDVSAVPGYNFVEFGDMGTPVSVTHIDGAARPMISLKPVSGQGRDGRELADVVLKQLATLDTPNALARVDFRETGRPIRRAAQSLLRRESGKYVWHLDVAPEKSLFIAQGDGGSFDDSPLDLLALFREFVSARTASYPGEAFTAAFLERGGRAITDAMLAEEAPAPEDDAVS